MSACIVKEVNGDLFNADQSYALAHCVAADLRMGKGIAVRFRDKFGQVAALKQQNVQPGGVAVLKHNNTYVYYLVTKTSSWRKPSYQLIHSSLLAMRAHMLQHGVTKVAMPRIGCGLDGMVWPKVKELLEDTFKNDSIEILIYNYTPSK